MQFEIGNATINLSAIVLLAFLAGVIYFLFKWSKELENRRFTIFLYFLISTYTTPIYSQSTSNGGKFEPWFPLGFAAILVYLYANKKNHPAKMKASLLGLAFALYKILEVYFG